MNTGIWICLWLLQKWIDHVNKHKWRCKARFDQSNHSNIIRNQDTLLVIDNKISRTTDLISCDSGEQCKGLKGLKAHHRSCKTVKSFDTEIVHETIVVKLDRLKQALNYLLMINSGKGLTNILEQTLTVEKCHRAMIIIIVQRTSMRLFIIILLRIMGKLIILPTTKKN